MMIAHIDADAFFASALQRRQPQLRGKPLLALGMGGSCVIAASYEAKAFGVKTGMPLGEAKRLCPQAIAVPSDFEEALVASREIEERLKQHCPRIEQMSVDEWYADLRTLVGGMPKEPEAWGKTLQTEVYRYVGLTVSVGMGPSKLLAKMASEYRKPAGVTVVGTPTLSIETFLQDRPAAAIPGIGRRRQIHTEANQWKTAWDIATANQAELSALFGKTGREMQRELLGESLHAVTAEAALPKSVSRCRSFRPTNNREVIFSHLLHHLTYTILKIRRKRLACRLVSVSLRTGEYRRRHLEAKLPQAADTEEKLLPYVRGLFDSLYQSGERYTQIGLALYGLQSAASEQYSLFEDVSQAQKNQKMQSTLDTLHQKFGREAVKRASAMATTSTRKKQLHITQ